MNVNLKKNESKRSILTNEHCNFLAQIWLSKEITWKNRIEIKNDVRLNLSVFLSYVWQTRCFRQRF